MDTVRRAGRIDQAVATAINNVGPSDHAPTVKKRLRMIDCYVGGSGNARRNAAWDATDIDRTRTLRCRCWRDQAQQARHQTRHV